MGYIMAVNRAKIAEFKRLKKLLRLSKVPLMLFSIFFAILKASGPIDEILANTVAISSRKRL